MATQLIELEDGTLVEVTVSEEQAQQISGGFAHRVQASFQKIKPLLKNACEPIVEAYQDLSQTLELEQAEVELGLAFEAEGNLYITQSKAAANLTVKLVLKPKPQ
jgi:hypothetical protein